MSMARGLREGIADVEARVTNRQQRGLRAQDQAIQAQDASQRMALNQTKIDEARVMRYADAYEAAAMGDEATAIEIYNRGTPREKWVDTIAVDEAGDLDMSRRGSPAKIPRAKIEAIQARRNPTKGKDPNVMTEAQRYKAIADLMAQRNTALPDAKEAIDLELEKLQPGYIARRDQRAKETAANEAKEEKPKGLWASIKWPWSGSSEAEETPPEAVPPVEAKPALAPAPGLGKQNPDTWPRKWTKDKTTGKRTGWIKMPNGQWLETDEPLPETRKRGLSDGKPKAFNPEGSGYDDVTAAEAGLQRDATGHMASLDPRTGMVLKGMNHKTIELTKAEEAKLGNKIIKKPDGRYYSVDAVTGGLPTGPRDLNWWNGLPGANEASQQSPEENPRAGLWGRIQQGANEAGQPRDINWRKGLPGAGEAEQPRDIVAPSGLGNGPMPDDQTPGNIVTPPIFDMNKDGKKDDADEAMMDERASYVVEHSKNATAIAEAEAWIAARKMFLRKKADALISQRHGLAQ